MKQFSCGAVVPGCTAVFSAEHEGGIFGQVAEHARIEHGIDEVPPALVEQVRQNIVEIPA
jgi:predicted small metal-binding protein